MRYALSDGAWSIDWPRFQGVIRRRMVAVANYAAIQSGRKQVAGGLALFGKHLEEIDIDFDGIRSASESSSEALVKSLVDTSAAQQQTGLGLRSLVCVECAADAVHTTKFRAALNASHQKNLAIVQAADAKWQTRIDLARAVRDLSIDAFFSLGAVAFPVPGVWKATHFAVKTSIVYCEKGVGKAASGVVAELALVMVPKQGKLVAEVFVNSARDTANALIDGKDLSEAVVTSLMTNIADQGVKNVVNSGEFRAWLSRKAIPIRIERSGPIIDPAEKLSKAGRKSLVDKLGAGSGKVASKIGVAAVGAVLGGTGAVVKTGEASVSIDADQFMPIAKSIVSAA